MPRFLTLDVEQGELHLVSAQVRSTAIKVDRALSVPEVGSLGIGTAAEMGRRLREAMKDAGIPPAPLLISVGRDRVVLKEIKLPPNLSAYEEANVVRFQAQKELTEAGDAVVVDYFASPTPEPDGQRRALAFAIRKDLLASYKALATSAGLKLVGITPRPFGALASLQKAIKDGAVMPPASAEWPVAVLTLGDKWGELLIGRGGVVIFSRSLSATSVGTEAGIVAEIRRNLAVFNGQSPSNPVRALYIVEPEAAGRWQGRIQEGIALPTFAYDPLAGVDGETPPESRSNFAGLAGLFAYALRPSTLPVNFVTPHEPRQERDPKQRKQIFAAALVGFILLAGLVFGRWKVSQKGEEVDRLQAEIVRLEDETKELDPRWKQYKAVDDWSASGVNWLDELYDLTARFPDLTDRSDTRLEQFSAQPLEQGKTNTAKHAARLELTIASSNPDMVDQLYESMKNDKFYSLNGREIKGASASNANAKNRQTYMIRAQVDHRRSDEYQMELTAPMGVRRDPAAFGKGGAGGGFAGGAGGGFAGGAGGFAGGGFAGGAGGGFAGGKGFGGAQGLPGGMVPPPFGLEQLPPPPFGRDLPKPVPPPGLPNIPAPFEGGSP